MENFKHPELKNIFWSTNPSTGDKLAKVAWADVADVDLAVAAAKSAYPSWSSLPGIERGQISFFV